MLIALSISNSSWVKWYRYRSIMTPYSIGTKLSKYHSIVCRLDSSIISLYLDTNTYFVNWILYTVVLAYRIYTLQRKYRVHRTQFWYRKVSKKLWHRPSSISNHHTLLINLKHNFNLDETRWKQILNFKALELLSIKPWEKKETNPIHWTKRKHCHQWQTKNYV